MARRYRLTGGARRAILYGAFRWGAPRTATHYLCDPLPVFVGGEDYSGRPSFLRNPVLRQAVNEVLAPELRRVSDALVIPLGATAREALQSLAERKVLDLNRCLLGLPHPSNGRGFPARVVEFRDVRASLADLIHTWAAAHW